MGSCPINHLTASPDGGNSSKNLDAPSKSNHGNIIIPIRTPSRSPSSLPLPSIPAPFSLNSPTRKTLWRNAERTQAHARTRMMLARRNSPSPSLPPSLEIHSRYGRMSAHSPDGWLPFVVVGGAAPDKQEGNGP